MEAEKQPTSVDEKPLLVVVFDRKNGKYCVDSGPWLEHGYIDPKRRRDPDQRGGSQPVGSQSGSGEPGGGEPPPEDVLRCLKSRMPGHTTHCHWHVWNGSTWVDTMKENCGACS
jgi:hypothetical protein